MDDERVNERIAVGKGWKMVSGVSSFETADRKLLTKLEIAETESVGVKIQ